MSTTEEDTSDDSDSDMGKALLSLLKLIKIEKEKVIW